MTWQADFQKIVDGFISDLSVEDGIEDLAYLTSAHPEEHEKYLSAIESAVDAARDGDPDVVRILNESYGHSVDDIDEARQFVERVRSEYVACYAAAMRGESARDRH